MNILNQLPSVLILTASGSLTFDTPPTGYIRTTTEIHGNPVAWAAHVENRIDTSSPFDGAIVALIKSNIEVENPPPSHVVSFTGSVVPIGNFGQHVEMSFYGPNAVDEIPVDDAPIFSDLYGTYTRLGGGFVGPVDLYAVQGWLLWSGYDASDLQLDPSSVIATVIDVSGQTTEVAFGQNPLRLSYDRFSGDPYERLGVGLYSFDAAIRTAVDARVAR